MVQESKVALITGGTSGIGLETAKVLAAKGWTTHLLGRNEKNGQAAAATVPNAHFHQADVTNYSQLVGAFDAAFEKSGRFDLIFANAGIMERTDFYAPVDTLPPPQPDFPIIDVGYKSFVHTAYLAQHYFRASPNKDQDRALLFHSSCNALYGSQYTPIYAGGKAGIVNFMRSIAFGLHDHDNIRAYAICPGAVKTNLTLPDGNALFPDEMWTPVEKVTAVIQMLIDGGDVEDSNGRNIAKEQNYGLVVETCNDKHYFRDRPEYCDKLMARNMRKTYLDFFEKKT